MRLFFNTLALATAGLFSFPHQAQAQTIYGLVAADDVLSFSLLSFNATSPGTVTLQGRVTGLVGFTILLGIERRPATGQLLALGYDNSTPTPQVRLYELNPLTAAATPVGPAMGLNLGNLTGKIGFSIDPTTDQIRVVTPAGNSYRLSPTTGALLATDANLAYASTDAYAGQNPDVQSISYTNNYATSPATQLFGIDKTGNRLVRQASAGSPALATVGDLGVRLGSFDLGISTDLQSQTNKLYLMNSTLTGQFSHTANWYTVNASTGTASLVGVIGSPNWLLNIVDTAVPNSLVTATRSRADLAADFSVYPNPTAGPASLSFRLPRAGQVELSATDALGRPVATPPAARLAAGPHTLRWAPQPAAPGLYLLRLSVDGVPAATERVLVK
ncbi:DUF4394 domain-containing protein [Hymenobacter ruricola]|uniref:DUF4394 domain-containing protein n=1 Tax=Hymenobacter ruricola TaxID=2791023 RepID=A0ABS0HZF0_9BACT|nr:DUF4394 domain-containing protein [Hymenobacter ruricola]MBF9220080.1 DUF4394 domain-containing protein [Hymenobacter ruricola]